MKYIQGRKETIGTDVFFILVNIRIDWQIDAVGFEGLLYTILSEEPFKNKRFHMIEETDDYTISSYVSHHFGMIIEETCTCLTCHEKTQGIKR